MTRTAGSVGILTQLLDALGGWKHRERACRRHGHNWSDRTDPIACARCGAMRSYGRWW